MPKNLWSREELLLTFNLYCKLPFGQFHQHNPEVIKLATIIGRTPSAVAMKLVNFASLDPYHQARGISGLGNVSKADRAAWEEFTSDWNSTAISSESLLEQETSISQDEEFIYSEKVTEVERKTKVRLGQQFFRKTILANYNSHCCICDLPVSELLVASHIIPWRDREDLRLNPHNGLCLCVLHDKGFDSGFIAILNDYTIVLSPALQKYLPSQAIEHNFERYRGIKITLPEKFPPKSEFLDYHYKICFAAK